jgi:hypothetical protein
LLGQPLFLLGHLSAQHLLRGGHGPRVRRIRVAQVLFHHRVGDIGRGFGVVAKNPDFDPGRFRFAGDPQTRTQRGHGIDGHVRTFAAHQASPLGAHAIRPAPDRSERQLLEGRGVESFDHAGRELRTSDHRPLTLEDRPQASQLRGHPGQGIGGHGLGDGHHRQPLVDRPQGVVVDRGPEQGGDEAEDDETPSSDDDHPFLPEPRDNTEAFFVHSVLIITIKHPISTRILPDVVRMTPCS